MPLQLNKLSDEFIQRRIRTLKQYQDELLPAPPQTDDAVKLEDYYDNTGENACAIGLMTYQQEGDVEEIRKQLRQAGELLYQLHAVRQPPQQGEYRIPWLFLKTLALLGCFPGKVSLTGLAGFEQWRYYGQEEHPEAAQLVRYLGVLKAYLAGAALDDRTALSIQDQTTLDNASKYERKFLLPQVKALRSVEQRHEAGLQAALRELVKSHQMEATKGELAKKPEGLVCLPGLLLAKMARDRGMQAGVESPYLPVKLLE